MKYLLSIVLISSFLVNINEACFCSKQHPQEIYCNADYAVKVLTYSERLVELTSDGNHNYIENIEEGSQNVHFEYEVRILKSYKGKIPRNIRNKIYSPYSGSLCGVRLETGRYYFLIGRYNLDGNMGIGACDYVMDITHHHYMTYEIVSRNFLRNWKKGCDKCHFCTDKWTCRKRVGFENTCIWNTRTSYLQPTLSYCSPSKDESGICEMWAYDTNLLEEGGKRKFIKTH